jgi:arylsulfatase A-like enzyme
MDMRIGNEAVARHRSAAQSWIPVVMATGWLAGAAVLPARGDNVLMIVADDLGVANVGAYNVGPYSAGGTPGPTPTIDALAASGVRFRNAWSNPVCSPTRGGFLTGRHAFRHGVGAVGGILPTSEVTIAEVAGAHGVASALIGKWHVGTTGVGGPLAPNVAGFDHYAGVLAGALPDYRDWTRTVNGVSATETGYATTVNVDDALAWIAAQRGPWVCIVAFNAPHAPWHKPPSALHTQDLVGLPPNSFPLEHYKAAIEAMDSEIGRLLTGLGVAASSTNVIFVGDNGTPGEVVEPPFVSSRAKGTVYQGGVHVPLIVSGPAVVSGDRDVLACVHTVDLFATMAGLAGADYTTVVPDDRLIDAISLMPYLANPAQGDLRSTAYTETFPGATPDVGRAAIRNAQYKVLHDGPVFEFYDLISDPLEATDLLAGALTSDQAAAFAELSCRLRALRNSDLADGCLGDMNCDGARDSDDVAKFVAALLDPAVHVAAHPNCPIENGDFTGDGAVDGADVNLFVAVIATP